jgi:hypothetical protein
MRWIGLALAVAMVAGCVQGGGPSYVSQPAQPTPAERKVAETRSAVEEFKGEAGCDGQSYRKAKAGVDELQRSAEILSGDPSYVVYKYAVIARDHHTQTAFLLADAAKGKGCLDVADSIYRGLISLYVGSAYGGIRDRARLGIEDIRELRSRKR